VPLLHPRRSYSMNPRAIAAREKYHLERAGEGSERLAPDLEPDGLAQNLTQTLPPSESKPNTNGLNFAQNAAENLTDSAAGFSAEPAERNVYVLQKEIAMQSSPENVYVEPSDSSANLTENLTGKEPANLTEEKPTAPAAASEPASAPPPLSADVARMQRNSFADRMMRETRDAPKNRGAWYSLYDGLLDRDALYLIDEGLAALNESMRRGRRKIDNPAAMLQSITRQLLKDEGVALPTAAEWASAEANGESRAEIRRLIRQSLQLPPE